MSADELRSALQPFLASKQLDLDELLETRGASDALDSGQRLLAGEVTEEEAAVRPLTSPATIESVLGLARKFGTEDKLTRAIELPGRKGFRVRPWKTSLMFTPPSNRTRMLFTLWARPVSGEAGPGATAGAECGEGARGDTGGVRSARGGGRRGAGGAEANGGLFG